MDVQWTLYLVFSDLVEFSNLVYKSVATNYLLSNFYPILWIFYDFLEFHLVDNVKKFIMFSKIFDLHSEFRGMKYKTFNFF